LPSAEQPVLRLVPFAIGDVLEIGGKRIEVLSAKHTVPAVGFAVDGGTQGWWVFSGDTGANPVLWQRLRRLKIAHLVIETAFSNDEHELARISRHLCPATLGLELAELEGSVDVYITHVKPGESENVMQQIEALGLSHRVSALAAGQVMRLDDRSADAPGA
jgi:ribonuclease BN (tRNA processing enzyme)